MSDTNELDRLRADLEAIERHKLRSLGLCSVDRIIEKIESRIATLEAEANPWREAQDWVLAEFVHLGGPAPVARYVQHLEADNAAKAARIAELEARPVPPLDPKRLYATWIQTQGQRAAWADAEPYPVAGDEPT